MEAPTAPLTAEAPAAEPSAEKPEAKAVEFPVQKQEPQKAPESSAPIHLDAAPKPEEHDHFDELEQMVNPKAGKTGRFRNACAEEPTEAVPEPLQVPQITALQDPAGKSPAGSF